MENSDDRELNDSDIAIVGMSGRFPKAPTVDLFWQNVRDGVEAISFFSPQEVIDSGGDAAVLDDPRHVPAAAVLDNIEWFDAAFFGFNPKEVETMDPQHRLFLECSWEALEQAGYVSGAYRSRIAVFAGTSVSTYLLSNLYANPDSVLGNDIQPLIAADKDYLATRVSYKLNLTGPSVTVQTACSTSLVATHMACQSLLSGESDIALAGGASIQVPQKAGYIYREGGIFSPDGHCRAFDAQARGTVNGSGVGVVVLKRLADALADHDTIHAVIKGSAINNDGALKVGYTAPSVEGQAQVILDALSVADVPAETIGYIEAHGTGTELGDPVEIAALTQAFRIYTPDNGFCAIGSVKTNLGHLDAAAGITGLIKTVLALKHQQIPPSLHFQAPNPEIDFANSPFFVNAKLRAWPSGSAPRRAGVSSFGIGGTNAHVILEEAPSPRPATAASPCQLLVLSAKTETALDRVTMDVAAHMRQHPALALDDVAYTLQVGKPAFAYRRILVCDEQHAAVEALETLDAKQLLSAVADAREQAVVFMFPGQGAQYVNMGLGLYQANAVFREHVEHCAELLKPHLGLDLREVLYPPETAIGDRGVGIGNELSPNSQPPTPNPRLDQTQYAQPALFVVEYALAHAWIALGVRPQGMIGHSIGEYVAACLSGVFCLEDALALVAARGRLMQTLPPGAMLAVPLPAQALTPLLGPQHTIAAINAPALCVVAGDSNAIMQLQARLNREQIECRPLHTSHAFHSAMMDPIIQPFLEQFNGISLHPPTQPYLSNVTGTWVTAQQATDPQYWASHLRHAVRFADGIATLLQTPERVLLEVGPGRSLSMLARQQPLQDQIVLNSLPHPQAQTPDLPFFLSAVGQLWLGGITIDWTALHPAPRGRVPLPTYPFERQRYWIEARKPADVRAARHSMPARRADLADWFYIPSWHRVLPPQPFEPNPAREQLTTWLLLTDADALGDCLVATLQRHNQQVVRVISGDDFRQLDTHVYRINPGRRDDYLALLASLQARGVMPQTILHQWSMARGGLSEPASATCSDAHSHGFYSLLFLMQALAEHNATKDLHIAVVTHAAQAIPGGEALNLAAVPLAALCKVMAQEFPGLICRSIDVAAPPATSRGAQRLADQLLAECAARLPDPVVAYRGNDRLCPHFDRAELQTVSAPQPRLRERGVYLITGGLGRIGLALAEYLARQVGARLVLVGRTALPPREQWPDWLATHPAQDATSQKIRSVQQLEAGGAEVLVLSADVADAQQMRAVIAHSIQHFGEVHGVIHAAGVLTEDLSYLIQHLTQADAEACFRPKVQGVHVLAQVLEDVPLDFCLLMSSLAAILGGVGFAAYAAANAFMDAFVHDHNRSADTPWISVNWDGWQRAEDSQAGHGAELALSLSEGQAVFQRLLTLPAIPQIAISTTDLQNRVEQTSARRHAADVQPEFATATHARPRLRNDYIAPQEPVEEVIASIWQELLGITQVGIHDDFFELNGHSLLATQVIARICDTFEIELPVRTIFESPTIAALAAALVQKESEPGRVAAVARLHMLINTLSSDEIQVLLAQQE